MIMSSGPGPCSVLLGLTGTCVCVPLHRDGEGQSGHLGRKV